MFKMSSASVLTLCLMAIGPQAIAQDQGGALREHLPLATSENLSETLDAPEYFNRSPIPDGDNLGDHKASQTVDMAGFKLVNLAEPLQPGDATPKWYVDMVSGGGGAGDNMGDHKASKTVDMNWKSMINLPDPVNDFDAVNLRTLNSKISSAGGASQADVDKNKQNIANTSNQLAYVEGEFWNLKSRVDRNQSNISGMSGNVTYLFQEIDNLKARIATLEGKH